MLCAIAFSMLAAGCNGDDKSSSVAVINAAQVYSECEGGKQAREYLEKLVAEIQNDLTAMNAELEKLPEKEREAAQQQLQAALVDYQQRIRMEEQQILNKLSEDYQSAVDEYRKTHNIALVLRSDVLVSSSDEADITKAIIEAMNKKTEAENKAAMAAQNATAEAAGNATADNATEIVVVDEGGEASTNATNATAE